ncbi:MFS transporter [Amycolatopsis sp. NPDC059021]|uniref:MFS transporter n=1 Tax=Amycolatopsis sp. NPDC059021 TaxID=3346704 RepID=UPI0036714EF8
MSRRPLILAIVLLARFTFPLTITGSSLALPDVRAQLGAGLSATQWVVNGYNACFAGFLVFTGSLADILGKRRVYAAGLALYCLANVVSALAQDIVLLDVVRAIGGVGAAAAVTGGSAIIAETFQGAARGRAFAMLGTVLGAGLAFGPTIGGLLVQALGWRAVFGVPALVAGVVLALVPLLPRGPGEPGRRIDVPGAAMFTSALLLLIFALVEVPDLGFGHPVIVGAFGAAAVLAVAFPFVERRRADPMFELGLLANPRFLGYAVAAGSIVFILVPLLVYLPSYLISVAGLGAGEAGVWLLMLTGPAVVLPSVGAALARRLPSGVVVVGSVAVTGVGAFLLLAVDASSGPLAWLGPLLLTGAGMGLSTGLLDGLAISSVRPEQSGMAAGMFNTSRLATETIAIAVVGAVLAGLSDGRLAGPGYTSALHVVCLGLGIFGLLATGCVLALSRAGRREVLPA